METALARNTDPSTSHAAAWSIPVTKMESKVFDALLEFEDGATSHEIAEAMDINLVSISPRLNPMRNKGIVYDTGEKRKGPSGRKSIVWAIT